ncbi:MAG: hypothetical protein WEG36_11710 [Gemmatimonadota bacterium]
MKELRKVAMLGVLGLTLAGCVEDPLAPPPPPSESELIHYWHFNNLPAGELTAVAADFSALGGAAITYPGTGAGYMDNVDPGSGVNSRQGQLPGLGLRPRNPANTRELIITAPSTGYEDIVVAFAVQRSSSGAAQEEFSYSTNGGTTWTIVGAAYDIGLDFAVVTFDLSEVAAVQNNANLRFRIRFVGEQAGGSSGNNRFDNFTVDGVPL